MLKKKCQISKSKTKTPFYSYQGGLKNLPFNAGERLEAQCSQEDEIVLIFVRSQDVVNIVCYRHFATSSP